MCRIVLIMNNTAFALLSLLLNLTLQSVDFLTCRVWCHTLLYFIAWVYYTQPLVFSILNRCGLLY